MRLLLIILSVFMCSNVSGQNKIIPTDFYKRFNHFTSEVYNKKSEMMDFSEFQKSLSRNTECPNIRLAKNGVNLKKSNSFYKNICNSILMLGIYYENDKGQCNASFNTAFCISEDGICVTNYGSFNFINSKAKKIAVMDYQLNVLPIEKVIYCDKAHNLVVFKVKTKSKLAPLKLAKDCYIGEEVFVVSHPNNMFYSFSEGIVSNKVILNHKMILTSANFSVGSYGGPIVNKKGEVIGICSNNKPLYYTDSVQSQFQMFINLGIPIAFLNNNVK